MRATALILTFFATPLTAHTGHITDVVAGHDHWVAGIALGVAAGAAIWGALQGAKDAGNTDADADQDGDAEPQEA